MGEKESTAWPNALYPPSILQSHLSKSASNSITKPCEYLACVKILEKCSQASPAKLLKSVSKQMCFFCY